MFDLQTVKGVGKKVVPDACFYVASFQKISIVGVVVDDPFIFLLAATRSCMGDSESVRVVDRGSSGVAVKVMLARGT